LTELLNICRFKQASLVVNHIPPENLTTFLTLYIAFTFFLLVQNHRSILSARIFWKRKPKPLMTMRYFPFSLGELRTLIFVSNATKDSTAGRLYQKTRNVMNH